MYRHTHQAFISFEFYLLFKVILGQDFKRRYFDIPTPAQLYKVTLYKVTI